MRLIIYTDLCEHAQFWVKGIVKVYVQECGSKKILLNDDATKNLRFLVFE